MMFRDELEYTLEDVGLRVKMDKDYITIML
jgi:hypothetical protein